MNKLARVTNHPAFLLALVVWFTLTGVSMAMHPTPLNALGAAFAIVGAVLAGQRFVARSRRGR
jgi:hypothetical protein